jgi:hypothetical protein
MLGGGGFVGEEKSDMYQQGIPVFNKDDRIARNRKETRKEVTYMISGCNRQASATKNPAIYIFST